MADAVTSQIIGDNVGAKSILVKLTNISDGSGESAVAKVDVSALAKSTDGESCSRVAVQEIYYDIFGMRVDLLWNASSNVICKVLGANGALSSQGYMDFRDFGGLTNNAGSGVNGDLLLTTTGHTSGDHYTIILKLSKTY
tara:strand:- start:1237 stop:1656 length:420 start_codon:yes stop_codon:yes gene_type:complete